MLEVFLFDPDVGVAVVAELAVAGDGSGVDIGGDALGRLVAGMGLGKHVDLHGRPRVD